MKGLFLDDFRNPHKVNWVDYPEHVAWTVVKSGPDFMRFYDKEDWGIVSLDHDLIPEHYEKLMDNPMEHLLCLEENWPEVKEWTGFQCFRFFLKYLETNGKTLPEIKIHTRNPVGALMMSDLLKNYQIFKSREIIV